MKKIISLGLVVLLLGSILGGCSRAEENTKNENLPEIIVGCDNYSPFSYADANGEMTGIDVELAREAFSRMGYAPEFVFINWEDKKDLLADGEIDCIWSSFTMTGREDEYNWAGPYMRSRQVGAVNEDSDIQTLQDLEDKVIAVQNTTKPEDIIRSHDGTFPQLRKVIFVQKRDLIFILLSKGYVDALAAHDTSVDQFMADTGLKFRILEETLQSVELGVAFDKKDTSGLNTQLTEVLAGMQEDGTAGCKDDSDHCHDSECFQRG
ncbi:substrate-binding periplasmic protein [Blautia sp. HCP3S3_H10_1]|uniref:substrate-binding periplasmic protein n=1 Tax=unclassified Blautia TaxID=2648079 RepID=UPI003F922283